MPYPEIAERLTEVGLAEDLDLLRETVELFIDDGKAMVVEMTRSAAAGEAVALQHAAHRLKGAALNVGALTLAEPAQSIERLARGGEVADAPALIEVIERELRTVGEYLRGLCSRAPASS